MVMSRGLGDVYKRQVLNLIRGPFHPRVTAVPRKRPRSFCQKCRWKVSPKHAYTLDPTKSEWADHAAVQAWCGNLSGNELTRNSSGNTRPQSSQLGKPLWTDPGLKDGISDRDLISTKEEKKKKKTQAANELSNILPNPRRRGQIHYHHHHNQLDSNAVSYTHLRAHET